PEAQVDRFMMLVKVGYPSRDEERQIMDRMTGTLPKQPTPVCVPEDLLAARRTVEQIYVDEKVKDYIGDVVHARRSPSKHGLRDMDGLIEYGASPPASIA